MWIDASVIQRGVVADRVLGRQGGMRGTGGMDKVVSEEGAPRSLEKRMRLVVVEKEGRKPSERIGAAKRSVSRSNIRQNDSAHAGARCPPSRPRCPPSAILNFTGCCSGLFPHSIPLHSRRGHELTKHDDCIRALILHRTPPPAATRHRCSRRRTASRNSAGPA